MPTIHLIRLHHKVKLLYQAQIAQQERLRIQEWRMWVKETWTTSPGEIYKWLKEDAYQPAVLIMKKDGSLDG